MKIHVTGNAGSGKTTFAKQLGEAMDLPVFGLDRIVWQEGWKETTIEERRVLEKELVGKDEWIIEGVSSIARQSSDIIILLDVPRYLCLYRSITRSFMFLFNSRPELPENCPEILILPKLIKIIWMFPEVTRFNILNDMNRKKDITLKTNRDKYEYLKSLRRD